MQSRSDVGVLLTNNRLPGSNTSIVYHRDKRADHGRRARRAKDELELAINSIVHLFNTKSPVAFTGCVSYPMT